MTYRTVSADDTSRFGAALAGALAPGDCVLLTGELGAGKSVLARGVARGLGVAQAMPSPTFTLMQPYRGVYPVYHYDLYRIEDPDEFYEAGLDEQIGGDGVALVEWPQRVGLDPVPGLRIVLSRGEGDESRLIELTARGLGERETALREALGPWEADV